MTPAQYRARFEPTTASVGAVSGWLHGGGFKVTGVEASRRYLTAWGTAAAAEGLFAVRLNTYRRAGATVQAPAADASVPAAIAGSVLGVTGLDTAPVAMRSSLVTPPPPAFVNGRPCSLYYGQLLAKYQADFQTPLPKFQGAYRDYAVCGYTGPQFRAAYGVDASGANGAGVSIGIVDAFAASTIAKDAQTYATRHGDGGYGPGQFSQSLPAAFHLHPKQCQTPSDWAGEETLDVEASHAMATGAKIRYYGAASCLNPDLQGALARVDDENKVSVVSNSYAGTENGETTGDIRAQEQVIVQGELQGITFLFSSGDSGDELATTGLRQTDYPASDPYATAVGGTSTAIGVTGSLNWQTGWGTHKYTLAADGKSWTDLGFVYGAGGGFSALFNKPAYQNGTVGNAARGVPDLASDADPTTGMLIGETETFPAGVHYGEYRIGGTSLASPLTAGMVADAVQHAGTRVGFLNPVIYAQARAGAGTLTDVTSVHHGDGNVRVDYVNGVNAAGGVLYSVRTFDQDSTLHTGPGWDDVTGLGTPNKAFITTLR